MGCRLSYGESMLRRKLCYVLGTHHGEVELDLIPGGVGFCQRIDRHE